MNWGLVLHQTVFGSLAAAGFGVLFNVALPQLPWCAASGAIALAVRTICLELGMSLTGASLAAALAVGVATELRWGRTDISQNIIGVVGCIPMIPGSLASKAILGLFVLTRSPAGQDSPVLFEAMHNSLLVLFTVGAIGTGLMLPVLLLRRREFH